MILLQINTRDSAVAGIIIAVLICVICVCAVFLRYVFGEHVAGLAPEHQPGFKHHQRSCEDDSTVITQAYSSNQYPVFKPYNGRQIRQDYSIHGGESALAV
jgi:hypothetical protein